MLGSKRRPTAWAAIAGGGGHSPNVKAFYKGHSPFWINPGVTLFPKLDSRPVKTFFWSVPIQQDSSRNPVQGRILSGVNSRNWASPSDRGAFWQTPDEARLWRGKTKWTITPFRFRPLRNQGNGFFTHLTNCPRIVDVLFSAARESASGSVFRSPEPRSPWHPGRSCFFRAKGRPETRADVKISFSVADQTCPNSLLDNCQHVLATKSPASQGARKLKGPFVLGRRYFDSWAQIHPQRAFG